MSTHCVLCYRQEKNKTEHLPLLTASSQQVRAIIASRAEQLLRPAAASINQRESENEISCTPAFGSSSLAKEAWSGGVASGGSGLGCCEADEDELLLAADEEEELLLISEKEREDTSGTEGKEENDGDVIAVLDKENNENGGVLSASPPVATEWKASGGFCLELGGVHSVPQATTGSLKTSFVEELQGVSYPTLWQLGACKLTTGAMADFYVPALSSVLGPSKVITLSVLGSWRQLQNTTYTVNTL